MNRRWRDYGNPIWNLGTLYFMVSTLCVLSAFVLIGLNPGSFINPWRGEAPVAEATFTSIPTLPPASDTPEPTATEAPATEAAVEGTPEPLPTQTPFEFPTPTPTVEGSGSSDDYVKMDDTPLYMPHPESCDSMWVAGAVTDRDGAPVVFMEVRLGGVFGELTAFSGNATAYGESGFEIDLGQAPTDSTAQAYLQLYAPGVDEPVSGLIPFDTFGDCNSNLILINFVQE